MKSSIKQGRNSAPETFSSTLGEGNKSQAVLPSVSDKRVYDKTVLFAVAVSAALAGSIGITKEAHANGCLLGTPGCVAQGLIAVAPFVAPHVVRILGGVGAGYVIHEVAPWPGEDNNQPTPAYSPGYGHPAPAYSPGYGHPAPAYSPGYGHPAPAYSPAPENLPYLTYSDSRGFAPGSGNGLVSRHLGDSCPPDMDPEMCIRMCEEETGYMLKCEKGMSPRLVKSAVDLIRRYNEGNLHPGIGTNTLEGGMIKLRARDGARVIIDGDNCYMGSYQGHARGKTQDGRIAQRLCDGY